VLFSVTVFDQFDLDFSAVCNTSIDAGTLLKTNLAAKACFKLTGTDILYQLLHTNTIYWYLYKLIHCLTDAHCYYLPIELHK
jgi:hypothetical protein